MVAPRGRGAPGPLRRETWRRWFRSFSPVLGFLVTDPAVPSTYRGVFTRSPCSKVRLRWPLRPVRGLPLRGLASPEVRARVGQRRRRSRVLRREGPSGCAEQDSDLRVPCHTRPYATSPVSSPGSVREDSVFFTTRN